MPVSRQGMGQYRYDSEEEYLTDKQSLSPEYYTQGETIKYRDICFELPENKYIKSSKTYYLHLELPQHLQYTTVVKVKLCAASSDGGVNVDAFQEIRELIIPPAPPKNNDQIFESIIVYEDPDIQSIYPEVYNNEWLSPNNSHIHTDIYYKWPTDGIFKKNYVYYNSDSRNYLKSPIDGSFDSNTSYQNRCYITQYHEGKIEKEWLSAQSTNDAKMSFDIVFSPKYNLTSGYPYILLEIDRTGTHQTQIQYVDDVDKQTYNGTFMNKIGISGELYTITNLLGENNMITAPIKTGNQNGNNNILNHIAVWSHPELLLAINGEEIKVGPTNFYELDDFTINFLGVVARDGSDRFTIDYQYPNS